MGKTNWRWHKERSIWNDNSRPDQDWFQKCASSFLCQDMTSKPKNKNPEGPQEPKRHIVLPGKRVIVGVEDRRPAFCHGSLHDPVLKVCTYKSSDPPPPALSHFFVPDPPPSSSSCPPPPPPLSSYPTTASAAPPSSAPWDSPPPPAS
jgi:hypothetical protein